MNYSVGVPIKYFQPNLVLVKTPGAFPNICTL